MEKVMYEFVHWKVLNVVNFHIFYLGFICIRLGFGGIGWKLGCVMRELFVFGGCWRFCGRLLGGVVLLGLGLVGILLVILSYFPHIVDNDWALNTQYRDNSNTSKKSQPIPDYS